MRSLRAVLTLVATLVVVGLPCVARACVTQAAADATEVMGMACPALGATHDDAPSPCGPVSVPSPAPTAPADDDDSSTSFGDGGDFDALPVVMDHRLGEFHTSGRRVAVPVQSEPVAHTSETSPRPPRI